MTLIISFNVVSPTWSAKAFSDDASSLNLENCQSISFDLTEAKEGDLFLEYLSEDEKDDVSISVTKYEPIIDFLIVNGILAGQKVYELQQWHKIHF